MPPLVLRAVGVVKVLGGSRVLRGVTASFAPGVLHVIEGANGSGKSTLLAILGGRALPSTGRAALVDGEVLVAEGRTLHSRVGWLGHDLGLYPDLTSEENVALHARLRGLVPREAWGELARQFGVEGLAGRRVRVLSRGQGQRIALVRAMVGAPDVLLLDEPSTGLDAQASVRLIAGIERVVAAGAIVVAVTHDAAFRERAGGKTWRLAEGLLTAAAGDVSRETEQRDEA